MELRGKLRDDIINGNAVLFLGAGVGIAAGLHGAKNLANYLFQETQKRAIFAGLGTAIFIAISRISFKQKEIKKELSI